MEGREGREGGEGGSEWPLNQIWMEITIIDG